MKGNEIVGVIDYADNYFIYLYCDYETDLSMTPSDFYGKTINFNNKELLEQYRQAINKKENSKNQVSNVQARGTETHSTRVFDDWF